MNTEQALQPGETLIYEFTAVPEGERIPGTVACTHRRLIFTKRRKFSDIDLDAIEVVEVERAPLFSKFILGGLGLGLLGLFAISVAPETGLALLLGAVGCLAAGFYFRPNTLTVKTANDTYTFTAYNEESVHAVAQHVSSAGHNPDHANGLAPEPSA